MFLYFDPEMMRTMCFSENTKIKEICSSVLFQKAYAKGYPRKFMSGEIFTEPEEHKRKHTFIDRNGNELIICLNQDNLIKDVVYIPYKQIYSEKINYENLTPLYSFIVHDDDDEDSSEGDGLESDLRKTDPLDIYLEYSKEEKKYKMFIGRKFESDSPSRTASENFVKNFSDEVKQFLKHVERERWWNDEMDFENSGEASERAVKGFMAEVHCLFAYVRQHDPKWGKEYEKDAKIRFYGETEEVSSCTLM